MNSFFNIINQLRKKISLGAALLVLMLIIFITMQSNVINSLSDEIDQIAYFQKESTEKFLEQALDNHNLFLAFWERDWRAHQTLAPSFLSGEALVYDFIDRRLTVLPQIAPASIAMLIKYNDEIIYFAFQDHRYNEYREIIKNAPLPPGDTITILNGEVDKQFGKGERIFLSGTTLFYGEKSPVYIYIGFQEQIMYENYIQSVNLQHLNELKHDIQWALYTSIFFMLIITFLGVFCLFFIRLYLVRVTKRINKISPVGKIAVQQGFMTEEQLGFCLNMQKEYESNEGGM